MFRVEGRMPHNSSVSYRLRHFGIQRGCCKLVGPAVNQ